MAGQQNPRGRGSRVVNPPVARTLRPSSILRGQGERHSSPENFQGGHLDTPRLPEPRLTELPENVSPAPQGGPPDIAATPGPVPESHSGTRRDRSPSAHSGNRSSPPIPPAKRSRVRQDREEDASPDATITADVADAYMQSSVPVFANDGHFRTPGPAPRSSQVPAAPSRAPVVSEAPANNLYRAASPGSRHLGNMSDDERVITMTDSILLQLFQAHGLELDRNGEFLFLLRPVSHTFNLGMCVARCAFIGAVRTLSGALRTVTWRFAHL